jgi:gliding motility-associated-like protein
MTDSLCLDSVRWNFGDPQAGTLNTSTEWCPDHYYEYPGNYLITLYYFHCDTVDSLTSVVEIFSEPHPYLGPDTFLCSNSPLPLDAGPGFTSYLWHNGSTMSTMMANDTGLYWVEVTNVCGIGRDSIYIRAIYESPELEVINDTSICWGDSIWIEVDTSNLILSWWDGIDVPGRYISQQGSYFAVVRDTNGCMDNDQWTLSHILPPNISLGPDTTICEGDMITLSPGTGFLNYIWNDGSTGDHQDVLIEGPVTVTVLNECGADSDTMWVYLEDCTATLYVPNAFTPNGDGLNDIFSAEGLFIQDFSLQIFDRWGRLVYHGTDIAEGWDGTAEGMPAPPGAYAWRLYFKTEFGREGTLMGTVILHR